MRFLRRGGVLLLGGALLVGTLSGAWSEESPAFEAGRSVGRLLTLLCCGLICAGVVVGAVFLIRYLKRRSSQQSGPGYPPGPFGTGYPPGPQGNPPEQPQPPGPPSSG